MDELLTMSKREITRLEVMQRQKDKRLKKKEAAWMLGISVRQIKRPLEWQPERIYILQ